MDRKPTHKRTAPRGTARATAGLTLQQILILCLMAVVGMGGLIWAALVVLSPGPSPAILAQAITPAPGTVSLPQANAAESGLPLPEPPVDCAAKNSGMRLASSARVIDSRTLEVVADGETLRVGLAGIRLPENDSRSGQIMTTAADFTAYPPLLLVQDESGQDADGRLLRYVFSGDRFLNLDLVRLGLAEVDPSGPARACLALFQKAEQQARAEHIGMWQPIAVPTATFMPLVPLDPSSQAPCDCASRPVCADFRTRSAAQDCLNACNDYNTLLDWDRDGLACEEIP